MERFWDFNIKKESKLLPLFFNESFRGVAISFLILFSSVYIYQTLLVLTSQIKMALLGVVLFYLITEFFKFWANFLANKLAIKYGLKIPIYLGELSLIICFLVLFLSQAPVFLIFLAPMLLGISAGLYWFGRHGLMAKIGSFHHFGKELGASGVVNTMLLITAPFLGGVLISGFGYKVLFLVSVFFVLCSMFFLKRSEEEKIVHDSNLEEIVVLFSRHRRMFLAYAGNAASATVYAVILPLYLFLIMKKEVSLGEFFSTAMILAAIVNLIIGHWVDVKGKKGMIKAGAVITSIIWLGRYLFRTIPTLFVLDIADRLTAGFTAIPLNVLSYQKAVAGHSTGRAILFRELAVGIGAMSACVVLILLIFLGLGLEYTFLIAGLFSLTQLLLLKGEDLNEN